ncbi:Ig-like domain-containing protein [Terrabacter sp. 2RAF25]|uniref:Ig-like domain-containing protein n=1 Tax=Terrabacter sp. 2RAF25 TaxID=3232998 RepID=UPI003F9E4E3A
MPRTRLLLLAIAALATVLGATSSFSSASFTSQSTNQPAVFTAASDWTPPTVAMNPPASVVSGTVSVSATASDAHSGLASVLIEYLGSTGSWTSICTAAVSPWSCSWDTTARADGTYALRATATDKSGNVTVSDPVSTMVANNVTLVLGDPGSDVRGSLSLSATIYGGGSLVYTTTFEYAVAGGSTWKTLPLCSPIGVGQTFTCTWNTTGLSNGTYDLRATAAAGSTRVTSASVTDVMVDNTPPSVTMTDPGATLSGTVTLGATSADSDSGVNQVVIQYAPNGTTTWTTACTIGSPPFTCRFDTTKLTNGKYDVRAVSTDNAGNTATSASVTGRTVDNTVSSVAMEDPGAYLTGSVTLTATATARTGVASVTIQRSPNGAGTWTTVCTLAGSSPFSCSWASTSTPDGLYDFRAVLTETGGAVTTSTVVSARRVDNTALRGADVQAVNGGATVGRIEANDSLTLTYTDTVKPASITPTFTGAAMSVQVRIRDGAVIGLTSKDDTLDVLVGSTVINLGSVNLKGDFIKANKTTLFNATMTASTTVVGSANRTVITLKLAALASGGAVRTAATTQNMVWTPSTSATDLFGSASSGAPVTETGTLDKDF